MTRYRPPRPGDIVTVRSSDTHLNEVSVQIHTVADNGGYLFLAGTWGGHDLEVVLRRVGEPTLNALES